MPIPTETLEVPSRHVRAAFAAETLDADARTVDLVLSAGATRRKYSWARGLVEESLDMSPAAIRMERINGGAPLMEDHRRDLDGVIGVIVPGSARVVRGELRATARFDSGERGTERMRQVREGTLGQVSIGYDVHNYEITEREGQLPHYRATDWEPFEGSLVAFGADPGAGTRSDDSTMHPCTFQRAESPETDDMPTKTKETKASEETRDGAQVEPTTQTEEPKPETRSAQPGTGPASAAPPQRDVDAEVQRALEADRKRARDIRSECTRFGLSGDFAGELVDSGRSLSDCRAAIMDKVAEQFDSGEIRNRVTVGATSADKARGLVEAAILHRCDRRNELPDDARGFRGMSLLELGTEYLGMRGIDVRHRDKLERAGAILGNTRAGGAMGTSDFPLLLANVASKTLRRAYDEAPQTFRPIVRETTVPDFKTVKRTQLGEAPTLEKVNEHGEFKRGGMGEAAEEYEIGTYGKIVGVTRQAIINDDLDAFSRIIPAMGRQVSNLESDLVWGILTANAAMADGDALFHANHGNVGSGALGITALSAMRLAMRTQTGLDGATLLNLLPEYLIVPAAQETAAEQQVALEWSPNSATNASPFRRKFTVIVEPRLDANSAAEWYASAAPGAIDTIELAYLQGQSGPFTEMREGFDIDGVEYKIRHDVGAKAIDWRGLYKSSGV